MANINFGIGFNVDKASLTQVKQEIAGINKMISERGSESGLTKEMKEALKYTKLVEQALDKATNSNLDKINVNKFNDELKKSNMSLSQMYARLKDAGVDGGNALKQLNRELNDTGIKAKQTSKILDDMFDTFGKTIKWGIASSMMNQMTGSVQRAVGFTKALDESLNNIRVVSGQNAEQMEQFAKDANAAAKALGKSTTEYTDASLLYFQQGKQINEVRELSNATLMAANITGTDVAEMADLITSALNGYSMAADKAIYVTDTLAAIGAATGSDFEELAIGMSKVASQAATVGVPFEKLNAMLATISETTREAPETIGTSLKTVFARMSEIKLSGSATDEDGVTMSLGKVQDALSLIDVSLVDTNDQMRDMGTVIEEIGGKWSGLNVETKTAITNALAGQRQASRLMALFNQWDRYEVALNEAMTATGTTMEQNEIRMESMSYKTQQMRAELERLWMNLINSDVLKEGVGLLTGALEAVNNLSESFGGMKTIVMGLGGLLITVFGKQVKNTIGDVTKGVTSLKTSFKEITKKGETPEKDKEIKTELAVRKGMTSKQFEEYKGEKGKLHDLEFEIKANKDLANIQKQRVALLKEYEAFGKEVIDTTYTSAEEKLEVRRVQALKEANAWQKAMIRDGYQYEVLVDEMTASDVKRLGVTKEYMKTAGSFEQLIKDIKGHTVGEGIILGTEDDLLELERLEQELKNIQIEADEAQVKMNKNIQNTADLESKLPAQQAKIGAMEKIGLNEARTQNIVKGIGVATMAAAMAGPVFDTFADSTATASDKLDAAGNAAIGMAGSLAMMGGPIGLAAGGVTLLVGLFIKLAKNFQAYDKAVEKNTATIERYKERAGELTDTLKTLEQQQSSMNDIQREIALAGGDISKLTDEQQESYRQLKNEIAQTTPEMVAYYTAEGDAILKANASLQTYIDQKKEALQLERDVMVANKESFLLQYSYETQQSEDRLKAEEEKSRKLREELNDLKASGASGKKVSKKESELESSLVEIEKLRTTISGIDKNIQENIINPFMLASEEIANTNDKLKQIISSTYELEDVQAVMDRYQYKWEIVNGQPTKIKRSYKEMAELTNEELIKMEEKALNVAKALELISAKARSDAGEEGEMFRGVYNALINADQATQAYIGNMSALGVTTEGTTKIISQLVNSMDEFGVIKPLDIDTLLPIATENSKAAINSVTKEIDGLIGELSLAQDAYEAAKAGAPSAQTNLNARTPEDAKMLIAANQPLIDARNKVDEIEGQINNKLDRRDELQSELNALIDNQLTKQQMLSMEYEKYLMNIASTPEGMNRIISSYNQQYEQMKLLNEEMTRSTTETTSVPGEVNQETGEIGAPTEVEVTRFQDSDLGLFFNDFETRVAALRDDILPGFGETFRDVIGELSDPLSNMLGELDGAYTDMGDKLRGLPTGVLDEISKMNDGVAESLEKVIEGSNKAADIDPIVKAVNKQQQALGRMYAVINKDSTTYYQDFKKQNQNQMKLVGLATGVMADDYATYAEYTAAQDKWMAENSAWLSNEKVANGYWAMVEEINAEAEAKKQAAIISGQFVDTAQIDADARAQAAEAAAWASAAAEAEAALERAKIMQQSLSNFNTSGLDKDIADAAMQVFNKRKAEIEVDLQQYQNILTLFNSKVEEAKARGASRSGGGSGGGGFNFNYNVGGGGVPQRPITSTPSPGGGSLGDGGGSDGGGGSDSAEKLVEDMEWVKDKYHDINVEIERQSKLLGILEKQQDKLYGKALLDNLRQQKALLEQQRDLQEQKLAMQKQDAKEQADALRLQGVIIDDSTGMIQNYNDIIQAKVNAANALSGDAKEAAIAETEAFIEALNSYEELVNSTIWDTMDAISEIEDQVRKIFLEELEFEIKLKIDISDDLQEALEFQKEMNDEFKDGAENYQSTVEQLADKMGIINDLQQQIIDLQARDDLTDKERLEFMESYSEQLKEALKDAKKLEEELTNIFKNTLKEGLDILKDHLDNFKDINKELDHLSKVLQLIGEGDNYQILDEIYEQQYAGIMGQIDVLNGQMDALQAQKAALEAAGMKGSDEWKAIDDAIKQTQSDINSLAQESLKLLQDEFKNSVDEILSTLENAITNNEGFNKLKDQQKDLKDERKKYLDQEEKLYEINKLQNKIQQEIDESNDPARRAELQKFMDTELKKLKEKDKLSQYDIDRANQMYDITLKQMALEDQRAAKNIMRLVRDTQGNWVYEFTEDAKAIEKAQQDVSDALYKLNELDKKRLEETQDEMLKLQEEYYKEVEQITKDALAGKYATEDEVRKALEAANLKYNEKMLSASKEYEQAKQNATISSMGVILSTYNSTTKDLLGLTDEQDKALKLLKDSVGNNFSDLQSTMDAIINGDDDSIKKAFDDLGFTVDDVMINGIKDTVETVSQDMRDRFGTDVSDMISDMVGSGGFKEATEGAVNSIMDKWKEYQDKVQDVKDKTGLNMDDIKDRIDDASDATEELNKQTGILVEKIKDELKAVGEMTIAFNAQREEILKNIKAMQDYIKELDAAIKKIKEKELAENPPEETKPPTTTPPTTTPPTTTPPTTTPSDPVMGSTVRVKSGRRWYYDSTGTNPSGPTDPYSNRDLQITSTAKGARYEYNVGTAPGVYLGWLKKEDLVGFDTGGYTGQWGSSGKMAMLHEKEIVLNKDDTRNLLDAVSMTRGVGADLLSRIATTIMETSLKTLNVLDSFARNILSNSNVSNVTNVNDNIQQNVTIHADFSGVKSSFEIEKAFDNMSNMASQYVLRK